MLLDVFLVLSSVVTAAFTGVVRLSGDLDAVAKRDLRVDVLVKSALLMRANIRLIAANMTTERLWLLCAPWKSRVGSQIAHFSYAITPHRTFHGPLGG